MLRPILLLAACLFSFSLYAKEPAENKKEAERETVQLVQFNIEYPPLQKNINGQLDGPDLQLSLEAFRRVPSFKLEIIQLPIARAIRDYGEGKVDIVFTYKNEEFKPYSLFPDYPLRWAEYRLVVNKERSFSYKTLSDLKGKHIGMINVVPLGDELQQAKDQGLIEVRRVASHRQAIEMLERGRVDAVFMYVDVALYYAEEINMELGVLRNGPVSMRGFFPSISVRSKLKNHALLRKELSQALKSMYEDGTHREILQRFNVPSSLNQPF